MSKKGLFTLSIAMFLFTSCITIEVESNQEAEWRTFTNEYHRFAFDYPREYSIEFREDLPEYIVVRKDPNEVISITATSNFQPGDEDNFDFTTPPAGHRVFGQYSWQTFVIPSGYGGPVGADISAYALQMETDDKLFTVVFQNQLDVTPIQEQIIASFRLLE
jgi:hypothetical protein